MPLPDRTITADYQSGACVLTGIEDEMKDPVGVRVLFTEVSKDAYRQHSHWRVPIHGDLDKVLMKAFPKFDLSADLVTKIASSRRVARAQDTAQKFLAAPLDEHWSFVKKEGLDLKMQPIGVHQVTSIGFSLINPRSALFLDTGLGKTYVGVGLCQILKKKAEAKGRRFRALVVAPKTLINVAWGVDIAKFSDMSWVDLGSPPTPPRSNVCPVCGEVSKGKHVRRQHLAAHFEVDAVTNASTPEGRKSWVDARIKEAYAEYPDIKPATAVSNKEAVAWTAQNAPHDIFICNPEVVRDDKITPVLKSVPWDIVLVDESTMLRSHTSSTTEAMVDMVDNVERRVIMTATPRPNTSLEFWGQMAFIDHCLGPSFSRFKNKYFEEDKRSYRVWAKPGAEMEISDIVSKRALRYRQRDCLDLPDEVTETYEIEMTSDMKRHYAEMLEDMATIIEDQEVSVNIKIAQMMKLAQIACGFAYNKEKEALLIEDNPRIKMTIDLCRQFVEAEDRQTVVWVRFSQTEGQMIKKILADHGITSTMIVGGMKPDDVVKATQDFLSGKAKVMIANAKSAQFGHTWVNASAMIFHSYDYSWESYYQCRKRIMRYGQKIPCTYVNVVCKGSIDKRIMAALQNKGDASAMVVDRDFMKKAKEEFEEANK